MRGGAVAQRDCQLVGSDGTYWSNQLTSYKDIGTSMAEARARRVAQLSALAALALAGAVGALALLGACSGNGKSSEAGASDAGSLDALAAQGCQPDRPATAYAAGAGSSSPASVDAGAAPIPCFTLTGMGTSESSIGIARDGTVFFAPAYTSSGNGVVRSRDKGATWELLVPEVDGGPVHARVQPFMYLDPSSDRVFFATAAGSGFNLTWSGDEGTTWNYEHIAPDVQDWIKIYSGPPVFSHPEGYPDIVYASAPSPISTPSGGVLPPPKYQSIYKSLSGGATWQSESDGGLTLDPSEEVEAGLADAATCPSTEWVIFGDGVVGADGTVYLGYRMCTELAVAISKDEGATWATVVVPGSSLPPFTSITSPLTTNNLLASEPVAVDASGNLYVIWNDAQKQLRMSVSTDHGKTWSGGTQPLVVSAPEVKATVLSAITVKSPGTVAIAYFGSPDGTKYDGYLAESTNALDPQPVFLSTTVNNPSQPLFPGGFDNNYAASLSGGDLDEFVQVKYAPDGDIWASFLKEMCPGAKSTHCTWDYAAHANSVFQGAVGRLVHAP